MKQDIRKTILFTLLLMTTFLVTMNGSRAQESTMETLAQGNTAFAFDLYHTVLRNTESQNKNLVFSPYSISQALAMVYVGANGNTQSQMQETLNFTIPQDDLAQTFADLNTSITERDPIPDIDAQRMTLNIANALWGQEGFPFLSPYVETINENFGAGLQLTDFQNAPDDARQAINDWAAEQTEDRIQDIIPQGAITPATRMVLANAIYFLASWANPFMEFATQDATFNLLDGTEVTVPLMRQSEMVLYADGEDYQVVDLPYIGGDTGMIIFLPATGTFESFRDAITAEQFQEIVTQMSASQVIVTLPRWEYESELELSDILSQMGMAGAFSDDADFSGIAEEALAIDGVLHKAFIAVDEEGTEAAAVTALTMRATSAPAEIFEFNADRPFVYTIYDRITGSVLFLGQVTNPEPDS